MRDADHRGLRHIRVADGEVLEVDGGDPLAAGLDHVLGAVGDLHVAERIDGGDVARVEEALLVEDLLALAAEIGLGHGGPAHFQAAEGLAVVRQVAPASSVMFISTLNGAIALLHLEVVERVASRVGRNPA